MVGCKSGRRGNEAFSGWEHNHFGGGGGGGREASKLPVFPFTMRWVKLTHKTFFPSYSHKWIWL